MIEGHGDDTYRYGGRIRYNFSTNIAPPADGHSGLRDYLMSRPDIFTSYPEPDAATVERELSETVATAPAEILVTGGATEAIYLIAQAFAGSESVIIVPTFTEYADACRLHGHIVRYCRSLADVPPSAGIVWLCNPNNPTGRVYPFDELMEFIALHREMIFVVDGAYSDYTWNRVPREPDAVSAPNMFLLGSFTKRYAIPGLRLGYAAGCRTLIERVRYCRMPWSVNSVAIAAAHYLLRHPRADYRPYHSEALRLAERLVQLPIDVMPTDCNFMLCRLHDGTAAQLKSWLVEHHGILIRDASNFVGLTAGHFRIAAQTPEINNRLINALEEWIRIFCSR